MNAENAPEVPAARVRGAQWWRNPLVWLALVIFAYGTGYLIWYLGTPLGRAPQLDGAENLALAAKIAAGTLPRELFYRAMLYPAVLALPLWLRLPATWLPAFAAIFGLLCHFAITLAVGKLAARLWSGPASRRAEMLAAALWGLSPVALFYAVDVLDTVPSLALFAWGLVFLSRPGMRARESLLGGLLLGVAVAARPNFLPVVVIAPLARAWLMGRWRPRGADFLAWAGAMLPLLALGCVQKAVAGEFRILPWQGAYNFYSANNPKANGRYFVEQIYFPDLPPGENPARRESELLYKRATDEQPPFDVAEMNAYWNEKAWAAIKEHPGAWFKLMARKTYYLFNDFDQYNNKTYQWHQEQSPWLSWNFLGWGIVLILAAGVAALVGRRAESPEEKIQRTMLAGILLVFSAYAAGVLVYYASGRFRLPLTPLLCVLVGGWATMGSLWLARLRKNWWLAALAMFAALFIAFSDFSNAQDTSTFIQDEMLSANAAADARVGDDALALDLAQKVLDHDYSRLDAQRVAVLSFFNLTLSDGKKYDTYANWKDQWQYLQTLGMTDEPLTLVTGVAYWKTGDLRNADLVWSQGADHYGATSTVAKVLVAARALRNEKTPGAPPPDPQWLAYLKNMPTKE